MANAFLHDFLETYLIEWPSTGTTMKQSPINTTICYTLVIHFIDNFEPAVITTFMLTIGELGCSTQSSTRLVMDSTEK